MFRYVVVNSQGLRNNRLRCNAFNNSNSTRGVTLHTGDLWYDKNPITSHPSCQQIALNTVQVDSAT